MTATSTAVTTKEKISTVRDMILKSKDQISAALPRHMNADRFMRVAMTQVQRNPALLDCERTSLIGAIIQSAQLGLETDSITGQAHLVPYWNGKKGVMEVQLIPGYKGLVKLTRNSGEVLRVEPRAVHAKDKFTYEYGTKPFITHKPYEGSDDPGEPTHFYAIAFFREGSTQFDVLPVTEVNKIKVRALEKKKNKDGGPWSTDFEEMGKKTAVRRLCKQVPSDVNLQRAIELDERAELGIPQDLNILANAEEVGTPSVEATPEAEAQPAMPSRMSEKKAEVAGA